MKDSTTFKAVIVLESSEEQGTLIVNFEKAFGQVGIKYVHPSSAFNLTEALPVITINLDELVHCCHHKLPSTHRQ